MLLPRCEQIKEDIRGWSKFDVAKGYLPSQAESMSFKTVLDIDHFCVELKKDNELHFRIVGHYMQFIINTSFSAGDRCGLATRFIVSCLDARVGSFQSLPQATSLIPFSEM